MQFLQKIFDFIFPPSEEELCVRELNSDSVLDLYRHHCIEDVHVLCSFKDARAQALIHESKFHFNKKAWVLIGRLVSEFCSREERTFDFILPVPLSKKRLRERGHNQVTSVLKTADLEGGVLRTDMLVRVRHTKPQTELPRQKRFENVRDSFGVADGTPLAGKHILLVDDVMTTGATLKAAQSALLPHKPASVTCLAFSH